MEQELFLLISSRMEGGDVSFATSQGCAECITGRGWSGADGSHRAATRVAPGCVASHSEAVKGEPQVRQHMWCTMVKLTVTISGSSVHNGLLLLSQTVGCFPITDEELFRFILVWFALHLTFQEVS